MQTTKSYPPLLQLLIYGNVFIAVCAASQVFLTQRLFGLAFSGETVSYIVFVLLSTFVQYNLQRGYIIAREHTGSERAHWVMTNRKLLIGAIGACGLALLFLCNSLSWMAIGIMVGAEVVSTLYYMPPFNLRRYGYVKPFLIGMVWMISCGLVPLMEAHVLNERAWYFLASQFCFVSSLGILFDIKDALTDFASGTMTYANTFGVKTAKRLAVVFLILSAALFHGMLPGNKVAYANDAMMLISCGFALASTAQRTSAFYYILIDGLMCLQGLVIPLLLCMSLS